MTAFSNTGLYMEALLYGWSSGKKRIDWCWATMGQQIWKEIRNRVQQESESLVVFHVVTHMEISPTENQEADTITKVQAIFPQISLEAAHWVQIKSGYRRSNIG